jgi:hypothetical protein
MTMFPTPLLGAEAPEPRSTLLAVAPAAVVLAVVLAGVLVLLTAVAIVGLVIEVRRDGYGLERPRPISPEYPWQTEAPARRRRRARARRSWSFLSASRTVHR